ncbi:hypothetical protein ABK040_011040 [Willaertia magna]
MNKRQNESFTNNKEQKKSKSTEISDEEDYFNYYSPFSNIDSLSDNGSLLEENNLQQGDIQENQTNNLNDKIEKEKQILSQIQVKDNIIVGMQSDDKSSFVEALLGFQFNTVESQIGTRRPLILQMINDPKAEQPICYFIKENVTTELEEQPTPVHLLEKEIKERTEKLCGNTNVSDKPIILKVNYQYCANLTIVDTPGFRKGEKDPLAEKINICVTSYIKQPNTIIVALEQSTVEWCNSQVRPIIKQYDPNFKRTVFVITKFNNRLNQFSTEQETNGYLATDNKIKDLSKVFYISLPSGYGIRNLAENDFKKRLVEVYLKDYKKLCQVGWDEKKFKLNLGFFNLKSYLEKLLNNKYISSSDTALKLLNQQVDDNNNELQKLETLLKDFNLEKIKDQTLNITNAYITNVVDALHGTTQFKNIKCGLTLKEERNDSNFKDWPNFSEQLQEKLPIINANYKLYGGAQLQRLLLEFEIVGHAQEFPVTTDEEVALSTGVCSKHTVPDYISTVTDLVQKKCIKVFKPLITKLLKRCNFVISHLFTLIYNYMMHIISKNSKNFLKHISKVSLEFLKSLIHQLKSKILDGFDSFIKVLDWNTKIDSLKEDEGIMKYDLLNPIIDNTTERVAAIIKDNDNSIFKNLMTDDFKRRNLTEENYKTIKNIAALLFARVRTMFVKCIKAHLNVFLIEPMFNTYQSYVRQSLLSLSNEELTVLLGLDITKLNLEKTNYQLQISKLLETRQLFTNFLEQVKK